VKSDTAVTIDRIFEMVTVLHAKPLTRADLARRWNITPRQVSNIVLRARDWCNVQIEHEPGARTPAWRSPPTTARRSSR
jgi:DNA-binding transcriptional regulator LsrR (DeoR family)